MFTIQHSMVCRVLASAPIENQTANDRKAMKEPAVRTVAAAVEMFAERWLGL